ncbi:WAS/WASL-interacting protein family member 3-like [Anabrus simplex]|uniref:WAS/WASL-interacting protein family member 3-like n=1 Tax=Anabrus simplex TaxID=316456 RepID=UPI0035A2FE4A
MYSSCLLNYPCLLSQITILALLASVSLAQQYSNGNYVDDYDYDNGPPAPRPASPSRSSFSRPPPAPARSPVTPAGPRPTPVPILKQINRHNEDGSYTYGYEGADGSFKIETKLNTGEVMGKYGYVDDTGKVRVVEYGANRYGFQPSGEGITVAPPTLVDESRKNRNGEADYDDGQYYEAAAPRAPPRPQIQLARPQPRPAPQPPRPAPAPLSPAPAPPRPVPQQAPRPAPQQARPAPPPQYTTYEEYAEEPQYRPAPPQPRVSQSPAPAPPRLQIPGAVPAGGVVYSPQPQHSPSRPSQPRPTQQHQAPVYHAQPIASTAPPLPPPPPPRPASRPAPQTRQAGGLLDQLARDYALPQGSTALSDISFGYYS